MNSIVTNQFTVFTLVAIIVALVVLGMFRLRLRLGLTPLYFTLGVFQPLQVLLASSVYAEILPGVIVSPGSVIMFTASIFAILLVYIREDALEARKIIYGIMLANLIMSLLMIIFGWQLQLKDTLNFLNLSPGLFTQNARVAIAGTVALFADVLLIIFVYEALWRWVTKRHFLCIYLTMALILVFDTLLFATGAFLGQPNYTAILISGVIGKLIMAVPFALVMTLYLYYGEHTKRDPQSFVDIFDTLSYRQKFELARQQRINAQKGLQISEDRFRQLFEHSPVPLWEEDFSELSAYLEKIKQKGISDFRAYFHDNPTELQTCARKIIIKNINQETLRMHKAKNKEELLGNLDKIFTEKSYDTFIEEVIALAEGQLEFETEGEVQTLDGEVRQVSLKLHVQKDSQTALLATMDITERMRAEEMQRNSNTRLMTAMDSIDALIYIADMQTYELLFVNKQGREVWGDVEGQLCWKAIQKDQDGPCAFCTNNKLLDQHGIPAGAYQWEFQNTINNRWYDCRDVAIPWADGHLVRMEIATDITEQKRIREHIIEEKNKLEAVLAALNDGLTVQDTNFTILYQNDVQREKQGDHVGEFCYQAYQNRVDICPGCLLVKCFADGNVHRRETSAITDKGIIHMEVSASPIKDASGNIVAAVETVRDITDKKKLESQLIQTQKMESIGQLAGGVAHDFNNMLSVILGYAELAMDRTAPGDQLHNDLREISNAARRSADITRQLLAFARKQTISPRVLDLNETIEGMLKMLRRLIGEDIDLSWQPGSGLVPVFMDQSQLDQVLANLCVNARDAISGVGELTIETENVYLDENYCADRPDFTPGDFVMLAVSDNGCGMDKKLVNKIFEPFFTTKDVGEGTGLGLSTVYGIVKQNNGFINVYSEPGKGTTFKIYLPRHQGELPHPAELDDTEIPQSRGETVLIVEDEASILQLARRILVRLGYKVLDANTPGQALVLAEKHRGEIHLLITDVVMPEMNGRELAGKLHRLHPDLKVLFMSGYTANVIAHHGILDEEVNFIPKPFSNRSMAVKVRETLDGEKR